MSVDTSR